jgi:adenylate cyclase
MRQRLLIPLLAFLVRLGAEDDDDGERRVLKLIIVAAVFGGLGVILTWGIIYYSFQELLAATFLFIQGVLTFASLFLFGLRRISFRTFYLGQFFLVFLTPFLVTLAVGGVVNASVIITWPFLAPMGALLVSSAREARRWFILYIVLIILVIMAQPWLRPDNNLPLLVRAIFLGMNLVVPCSFLFLLLDYFVKQKDMFFRLLEVEQRKAENLLLNVLPPEIAAVLKNETRTIADYYAGASILFADVVNFTPLSAQLTPTELVDLLNEVFTHFDGLVEEYGLEKIKTIGDCYMVAAGVPRHRPDHADVLARLALDMRDYTNQREFRGRRLTFRIGINSGPVVAGVIGRKKFIYDLWGDAVNTASRMESHGASGVIQVTRATYDLIAPRFTCEPRGLIQVKGKGEMEVWHVLEDRDA